jgi:hypothetical protein
VEATGDADFGAARLVLDPQPQHEALPRAHGPLQEQGGRRPGSRRRDLVAHPEVFEDLPLALQHAVHRQADPLGSLGQGRHAGRRGQGHQETGEEALPLAAGEVHVERAGLQALRLRRQRGRRGLAGPGGSVGRPPQQHDPVLGADPAEIARRLHRLWRAVRGVFVLHRHGPQAVHAGGGVHPHRVGTEEPVDALFEGPLHEVPLGQPELHLAGVEGALGVDGKPEAEGLGGRGAIEHEVLGLAARMIPVGPDFQRLEGGGAVHHQPLGGPAAEEQELRPGVPRRGELLLDQPGTPLDPQPQLVLRRLGKGIPVEDLPDQPLAPGLVDPQDLAALLGRQQQAGAVLEEGSLRLGPEGGVGLGGEGEGEEEGEKGAMNCAPTTAEEVRSHG